MGLHGACPASVSPLTKGVGGSDRGQRAATIPTPLLPGLQPLFQTPDSPRGSFPFPLPPQSQEAGGTRSLCAPGPVMETNPSLSPAPSPRPRFRAWGCWQGARAGLQPAPSAANCFKREGRDGTGRLLAPTPLPHAASPGTREPHGRGHPAPGPPCHGSLGGHGPVGDKEMLTHWGDHTSRWLCAVDFHLPGHAGDLLPFY